MSELNYMPEKDFEKLVKKAVMTLPKHIREKMDNLAIVIENKPSLNDLRKTGLKFGSTLLGLYQGVPQTTWGRNLSPRLPDKITIFQDSIERLTSTPKEITELVQIVVWHEIAHHFGFSEKQVRSLEAKWRKKLRNY